MSPAEAKTSRDITLIRACAGPSLIILVARTLPTISGRAGYRACFTKISKHFPRFWQRLRKSLNSFIFITLENREAINDKFIYPAAAFPDELDMLRPTLYRTSLKPFHVKILMRKRGAHCLRNLLTLRELSAPRDGSCLSIYIKWYGQSLFFQRGKIVNEKH